MYQTDSSDVFAAHWTGIQIFVDSHLSKHFRELLGVTFIIGTKRSPGGVHYMEVWVLGYEHHMEV